MLSQQKLTFISRKPTLTLTDHVQCHSPQRLALLEITWLVESFRHLVTPVCQAKSWFSLMIHCICTRNALRNTYFALSTARHKVNCDLSFFFIQSVIRACNCYRHRSAWWQTFAALFSFNLLTVKGWGHVGAFLCGAVITNPQLWVSGERNVT